MIRKIADEDPDEANDKDKKGITVFKLEVLAIIWLDF